MGCTNLLYEASCPGTIDLLSSFGRKRDLSGFDIEMCFADDIGRIDGEIDEVLRRRLSRIPSAMNVKI